MKPDVLADTDDEVVIPQPVRIGPAPGQLLSSGFGGDDFGEAGSPQDLSVDTMRKLTHAYLNTNQSTADIALSLGISTPLVRKAIKHFGLSEAKEQAIAVMRQEEAAAYAEFLAKSRVPTAQRHLEISNQIVEIVGKLTAKVTNPDDPKFVEVCKDLKSAVGTLRTLAEVLEKSSGVGARSVNLGGISGQPQQLIDAGGRTPLISFNLNAQPAPRRAEDVS